MSTTGIRKVSPGALHRFLRPALREELGGVSLVDLSAELLARLASGQRFETNEQAVLGQQLCESLAVALDVHENRFAAHRYADLMRPIIGRMPPAEFRGTTVVDLGCGSLNPFGFSFLLLMLGARRAYAIDLEPVQDLGVAVRAMATAASWLLLDSRRILGSGVITPEEVIRNLEGFQLPLLSAGSPEGIAADRLMHRIESIDALSLADGEADAVFSVSLFEHVERVDDALDSLHRITKPGGIGNHVIDFSDHRVYAGQVTSPFEFLKIDTRDPLVYGSNRIRCDEFCQLFERHGFAVEQVHTAGPYTVELREEEREQFVEPFKSMRRENLSAVGARIVVRRR